MVKLTDWFIGGLGWFKGRLFFEPPFLIIYALLLIISFFASGYRLQIYRVGQQESLKQSEVNELGKGNSNGDDVTVVNSAAKVGDYILKLIRIGNDNYPFDTKLQISKRGKILYETSDYKFVTLNFDSITSAQDFIDFNLKDITGNKVPELIFMGYSGGAHCCSTIHIIELGDKLSVLGNFDVQSAGVRLKDLNSDGVMEILTGENVFDYWNSGYATSPSPDVILSFNKTLNEYVVNTNMMRRPAPTQEEMESEAKVWTAKGWEGYGEDCKSWPDGGRSCSVPWQYALDLIYSGNFKSAISYVDLAWRDNNQFGSKESFWNQLIWQIKKSNYYSDISSFLVDGKSFFKPASNYSSFTTVAADTDNHYIGTEIKWYGVVAWDRTQIGSMKLRIVDNEKEFKVGGDNDWFWLNTPMSDPYPEPNAATVMLERYAGLGWGEYDDKDVFQVTGRVEENDCTYDSLADGSMLCHPSVMLGTIERVNRVQ